LVWKAPSNDLKDSKKIIVSKKTICFLRIRFSRVSLVFPIRIHACIKFDKSRMLAGWQIEFAAAYCGRINQSKPTAESIRATQLEAICEGRSLFNPSAAHTYFN